MKIESLSNVAFKIMGLIELYIQYICQNKVEEADAYLDRTEKLLDIDKISLYPKRQIANDEVMIWILYSLANIYLYDKNDFSKGEKIFKILESALDANRLSNVLHLRDSLQSLLKIYKLENRWLEVSEYGEKYLKLLKLANDNEIVRQKLKLSKADIEKKIKKRQAKNLYAINQCC